MIPNLKYKTNFCNSWSQGLNCEKGIYCHFAHDLSQLRSLQQIFSFIFNWLLLQNQLLIASKNYMLAQYQPNANYKTIYCKFFAKGECKLGSNCSFAHQKKQKRKFNKNEPYTPIIQPAIFMSSSYYMKYPYFQQCQASDTINIPLQEKQSEKLSNSEQLTTTSQGITNDIQKQYKSQQKKTTYCSQQGIKELQAIENQQQKEDKRICKAKSFQ